MAKVVEGQLSAAGMRIGLVVSRFNSFITEHLVSGAVDAIVRHGGSDEQITIAQRVTLIQCLQRDLPRPAA